MQPAPAAAPMGGIPKPRGPMPVVVTDVRLTMGQMCVLAIKWTIACIPAMIILWIILGLVAMLFSGIIAGIIGASMQKAAPPPIEMTAPE